MVVSLPLIINLKITHNERTTRDTSNDGFEYSYQLGPGGYASFSLPSISTSLPSQSSIKIHRSFTPVPVFLNNPLYKSTSSPESRIPTVSNRESLAHSLEYVAPDPASLVSHRASKLP